MTAAASPQRRDRTWWLVAAILAGPALLALAALLGPTRESLNPRLFAGATLLFAGIGVLLLLIRSEPVWAMTLGLMLAVFSGNWEDLGFPVGLDRVLLLAGFAAVLYRVLVVRDLPAIKPTRVHLALVVVSLYAIGSALYSGTLSDVSSLFALADKLSLVGFMLYVLAPAVFGTERQRKVLCGGLVLLGAYLGITAIFEVLGPRSLVFPSYISDPATSRHFGRARGPFLEAAANGLTLYGCMIAAVIGVVSFRSALARYGAGLVVLVCGIGIVLTLTRQVWLGAVIGTLVTFFIVPGLRRLLIPTMIAIPIIVVGLFVSVPSLQERASERASSQRPVWDRLNSNRAAVNMVQERPLLGFGWDRFKYDSLPYYRQSKDYPLSQVDRVHNVLLANAVDLGLVGLTLWLFAVFLAIGGAMRRRPAPPDVVLWRNGLIAFAACFFVVSNFTPLYYAIDNYMIWLWAGVVTAGSAGYARERAAVAPARIRPVLEDTRARVGA